MNIFILSSLLVIVVLNLLLGGVILFHGPYRISSLIFGLMILGLATWGLGIAGFYSDFRLDMDWIAITHSSALIVAFLLSVFSLFFPQKIIKNYRRLIIIISLPLLVVLYFLFFSDQIVGKIIGINYELNQGYIYYQFLLIFYFLLAFFLLSKQYIYSQDKTQKKQVIYIFIGSILTAILGLTTNLFLPFLRIFEFTWLGPIFTFILIISIAYAILQHSLFNVRVIATELFVFSLWIAIFVKTIISDTLQDFLISGSLLLATVLIGFFLIRSVIKEVRQREQIEKLAEQLKTANKHQEELLHFITHQIKGVLGKSKAIFAGLLEGDYGRINKQVEKVSQMGLDSSTEAVQMVQNILQASDLKTGQTAYSLEKIDFKQLVEETIKRIKPAVHDKGLKINKELEEEDFTLVGDREKLKHVIHNLLDNAVRYTPKGRINVFLQKKKEKIVLVIEDTGVGLSKEDKVNLFNEGGKGKQSLEVNPDSTGYGLFIIKNIVQAHQGRVWAESKGRNQGSKFVVEIPVKTD